MILAGITLFNPNIEGLKRNIKAIIGQVDKLICVDNGTQNIDEIEVEITKLFPDVYFIKNGKNLGIATALNQMFQFAEVEGFDWVLTLDQDSVCPKNIISEYRVHCDIPNLGSLCPIIDDRNYENKDVIDGEVTFVDKCITSASMTPVSVWKAVNGFLDELFIDFVDHDFSAKLIENNYKIVRVNGVFLEHEIGKGETHNFFGKEITVLNHSSFRKYYMARNWIYYMKAHKAVINYKLEVVKYLFFFIKTLLFEENKKDKLKEMYKGFCDSYKFCKQFLEVKGYE